MEPDIRKSAIMGAYFRNKRIEKRYTIRGLEAELEQIVTFASISQFETGKAVVSSDSIDILYNALHIQFDKDNKYLDEKNEVLEELVAYKAQCQNDKFKETAEAYISRFNEGVGTFAYPFLLICKFCNAVEKNEDTSLFEKQLDNVVHLLSTKELSLFYLYLYLKGVKEKAPLNKNEKCLWDMTTLDSYKDERLSGIAYYLLGMIYQREGKPLKAIELQRVAYQYFNNRGLILRGIYSRLSLGMLYKDIKNYDLAKIYSLQALEMAKSLPKNDLIFSALNNLANVSLQIGDYKTTRKYSQQILAMNYDNKYAYVLLADCAFYEQNVDEFDTYMRCLDNSDDYFKNYVQIRYAQLHGMENHKYFMLLKDDLVRCKKEGIRFDIIQTLQFLIDYCEKNGKLKELCKYQKELLSYYQ